MSPGDASQASEGVARALLGELDLLDPRPEEELRAARGVGEDDGQIQIRILGLVEELLARGPGLGLLQRAAPVVLQGLARMPAAMSFEALTS